MLIFGYKMCMNHLEKKKILLHLIPTCGRFRCPDVLINWLQVMLETCLYKSEQVVPHIFEFHTT